MLERCDSWHVWYGGKRRRNGMDSDDRPTRIIGTQTDEASVKRAMRRKQEGLSAQRFLGNRGRSSLAGQP